MTVVLVFSINVKHYFFKKRGKLVKLVNQTDEYKFIIFKNSGRNLRALI